MKILLIGNSIKSNLIKRRPPLSSMISTQENKNHRKIPGHLYIHNKYC